MCKHVVQIGVKVYRFVYKCVYVYMCVCIHVCTCVNMRAYTGSVCICTQIFASGEV